MPIKYLQKSNCQTTAACLGLTRSLGKVSYFFLEFQLLLDAIVWKFCRNSQKIL